MDINVIVRIVCIVILIICVVVNIRTINKLRNIRRKLDEMPTL